MNIYIKYIGVLSFIIYLSGCKADIYDLNHEFIHDLNHEFSIPKKSIESPLVQFIIDKDDYTSIVENKNLTKTLDYIKIPYKGIPLEAFNSSEKIDITTRVICINETTKLSDKAVEWLLKFVAKGGFLYITKPHKDERTAYLIGLNKNATWETNKTAEGFYFKTPIFPGKKDFNISKKRLHSGLSLKNFSDKTKVLVSAYNETNYPVLLENKIGNGSVVLFNSLTTLTKEMRGYLLANLLKGLEGIPYPIANVATIFLDDFPSPTYNIYKEPIKTELNLTISDYVKDIWWPDMKKYAIEEDIKYTAYTTFNYNINISPPFTFNEWDKNTVTNNNSLELLSSWIGRDVLKSGHELGFHGYNHVSLKKDEWKNTEYIVTSLKAAAKKWKTENFNKLPISYVPPSNYIDSTGIAMLHKGMPTLKYMQSVFFGHTEDGGNREFDPDPYSNKFFDYPRISSGYFFNEEKHWDIESMYLYTGIWTHFIHPDDVYQIPNESNIKTSGHFDYRNPDNLNWYSNGEKTGLFDNFKNYISDYKKRHPYSRFYDATKSSEITINWRYSYYKHSNFNGNYQVESKNAPNKNGENYWLMYADNKNVKTIDKSLEKEALEATKTSMLNGYLYSIKTLKPEISVPDLHSKIDNNIIVNQVKNNNTLFLKSMEEAKPFIERLNKLIANNKIKEATDLIEPHLKHEEINTSLWKDYAKYMNWQNKDETLWIFLDDYYATYESKESADLSRIINTISPYPTNEERKKWLTRQINWNTNDESVLTEYLEYFYDIEHKKQLKKILKKLISINPSEKNKKIYLNYLFENEDDDLLKELEKITPCNENYKELATPIAWTFADNLKYARALLWYDCSTINNVETKENWLLSSNSFEKVKANNYEYYIELLLANDPKKAIKELKTKKPCSNKLKHLSKKIALNYADYGDFSNALKWSKCAKNIKIKDKLTWYFETKNKNQLKSTYKDYILNNLKDYETKMYMATLMMYQGDMNHAIKVVYTIPKEHISNSFKKTLNKEIKNMSLKYQIKIYNLFKDLLDPEIENSIAKKIRQDHANTISFNAININDRLKPITHENILSYSIHNKNRDMHSFSGTQSIMYAIQTGPNSLDNIDRSLLGVQYMYSKKSIENFKYAFSARIEKDNLNKLYYQASANINYNKNKNFTAFELNVFPVKSGPGHSLELYRTQFTGYKEIPLSKKFKQTISLETNYYSDKELDVTLIGQLIYKLVNNKKLKVSPLVEALYGKGTIDRRGGYPYWMDNDRIYGGAGVLLNIGSEESKFNLMTDFGIFAEKDEANFERYTGILSYKIKDFTTINAGYEIYTIEGFFSNVFQLGLAYKFK